MFCYHFLLALENKKKILHTFFTKITAVKQANGLQNLKHETELKLR